MQNKKSGTPEYTQGGFDKQLNYSLWSASRIRFIAARKLSKKNERSSKAVAFLSAYLILYTLLDFLFLSKLEGYNVNFIIFTNIMFSLLILIFSQNEASASYSVRAYQFHQCALRISRIYKELRRLKSKYHQKEKDNFFHEELARMDDSYEEILAQSENHEMIDYELFKATYPKYEDHNLTKIDLLIIKTKYYFGNVFFYNLVTYFPFVIFMGILILLYCGKGSLIFNFGKAIVASP
ncbi:MAG: SLATT domain-containing protein [Moraxellaceae bacterium]|nr:SLATT domain-containing protein [Moraxellaceae bacterium]